MGAYRQVRRGSHGRSERLDAGEPSGACGLAHLLPGAQGGVRAPNLPGPWNLSSFVIGLYNILLGCKVDTPVPLHITLVDPGAAPRACCVVQTPTSLQSSASRPVL